MIARSPYWAWEQAAFFLASRSSDHSARARRLYDSLSRRPAPSRTTRAWHLLILEELIAARGIQENPVRFRLMAQLIALGVYQQFWILRLFNPAWSYRLNADIEDHAEHEYAALVAEHPEWENDPFPVRRGPRVRSVRIAGRPVPPDWRG